jgi:RecA-family ATPase
MEFFDPNRSYKFRHLQNAGLVRDRDDLEGKKKFGFPPGRLLTPRDRQWTGKELNDYLASRPTTQSEFAAQPSRPAPAKVTIPKKKPNRLLEQVAAAPTAKRAKDIIAAATLAGEVEAIAMVTGRNLLGEQPEERLRVWFHNGEDPLDEIDRRLAAICQHFKIPQDELTGWLWTTSGNEFPLRVAKGYANFEVNAVLVRQISVAIVDNQIDLAIFDPLVTLHSVSEIDTGKMDAVIRLFAGIADDTDAAIELAHHVRKPAAGTAGDYDVHDIRGVAAITDAVRAARVLNRMNERDAEAAECSEVERLSRFRVDRAKGNYSPAQAATWRQFISVELPNGDDVGVVAPWNFPGQGEQTPEKAAADQKAEQLFLQLLDKFTARGANVSANSGPAYAPAKFAEVREAKTARVSKAALKAAMNRLLDSGRIRTEPFGRDSRGSRRLVSTQGAQS